jgi:hypothetical protein
MQRQGQGMLCQPLGELMRVEIMPRAELTKTQPQPMTAV